MLTVNCICDSCTFLWEAIVNKRLKYLGLMVVIVVSNSIQGQPLYRVTDLNFLLSSLNNQIDSLMPTDINDNGFIVGSYRIKNSSTRGGFLFDGASFQDMKSLGFAEIVAINDNQFVGMDEQRNLGLIFDIRSRKITELESFIPAAINNKGYVVGKEAEKRFRHALFFNGVNIKDLGALTEPEHPESEASSFATDINDNGEIVGASEDPEGWIRGLAVKFEGNDVVDLDIAIPDTEYDKAVGINNGGQIIVTGSNDAYSLSRSVLIDGELSIDLGILGEYGLEKHTEASDINDKGQVVGWLTFGESYRAFYWDSEVGLTRLDQLIDPEDPLWGLDLSDAFAINEKGQILASSGSDYFLLTPIVVPLPGSLLLFFMGLFSLQCIKKKSMWL